MSLNNSIVRFIKRVASHLSKDDLLFRIIYLYAALRLVRATGRF